MSYVNKALATPDLTEGNIKNVDYTTLLTRYSGYSRAGECSPT